MELKANGHRRTCVVDDGSNTVKILKRDRDDTYRSDLPNTFIGRRSPQRSRGIEPWVPRSIDIIVDGTTEQAPQHRVEQAWAAYPGFP